jgi:FtsP/CotA-like multicopper oxidase with cupredoxin domain
MLIHARSRAALGFLSLTAVAWVLSGPVTARFEEARADAAVPCGEAFGPATDLPHSRDLFCLALTPPPRFAGATGSLVLRRIAGPFAVNPTPDGRLRYAAVLRADGLPPADSLGSYDGYGAWVVGPSMYPMRRLGPIEPGRAKTVGEVDLNRFVILVAAEDRRGAGDLEAPAGPIVLRGQSPSMRRVPADFLEFALGAAPVDGHADHEPTGEDAAGGPLRWTGVPMPEGVAMLPAIMRLRPDETPWLPDAEGTAALPASRPRSRVRVADGDTLRLTAMAVRHRMFGRDFVMYGFNGQIPGPLLDVDRDSEITVEFTNDIPWPTAVHWHGLRLDNASDGVPFVTQEPVPPGGRFTYSLRFPDAGIYWYHPHHREDVQQDLGLYGNMVVASPEAGYYGPVHREEVLMLDDLLVGDSGLVPYGREGATHLLSGRFGNEFLVNGRPDHRLTAERGEVVRFFLTNVSNTRTFNLSFGGAPMKIVGSDVGNFEREEWVESVVLAPAERYVVHVKFDEAGRFPLLNRVQALDHLNARFFAAQDTLSLVEVRDAPVSPDLSAEFRALREPDDVARDLEPYRELLGRPVDRRLVLDMRTRELPLLVERLMQIDSVWFAPVEWAGTMPMMNWTATARNLEWVLRDPDTGRENLDIDWRFDVGDVVKIRLHNERRTLHAMQHPIHLHGQRFLVVQQDGVPNDNLVWKDTALIPVGSTIDILLDVSNPGAWMLHCHVAEHLEAGMKMVFHVAPGGRNRAPG